MTHDHGGSVPAEHSHGGSARGAGWDLIDGIVLGCALGVAGILAELAWKAWREQQRARYDLTDLGRAATRPRPPAAGEGSSLVDVDALSELFKREQAAAAEE